MCMFSQSFSIFLISNDCDCVLVDAKYTREWIRSRLDRKWLNIHNILYPVMNACLAHSSVTTITTKPSYRAHLT